MKRIVLLSVVIGCAHLAVAQKGGGLAERWRHSVGASVHLHMISKNVSPSYGVFYNPQINIVNQFADFSLAATLPVTLGVHIKDSWIKQTYFYGHIPAVLEANVGHYSTRDFRSDLGGGFGVGYAAQINGNDVSSGFVATAALRTWIFKGSLTFRYLFHLDLVGQGGYNTHSLGVAVNLGRFLRKIDGLNKLDRWQNFK